MRHAMIIGSMKSGTTSLFDLLVRHPQICGSSPKEPEFFSQRQSHRIDTGRYADLFDFDRARHRVCLEASTGYSKFPMESGVPERIRSAGLDSKFIYLTRDPIKRFESHLLHVGIDPARIGERDFEHALAVSSYHRQLAQFTKVFSQSSILIVDFAELLRDSGAVVGKIVDHLGLEPAAFDTALPHSNKSRTTLRHWVKRSRLAAAYNLLPGPIDRLLTRTILHKLEVRTDFGLSEEQKRRIRELLRDDVARLRWDFGFEADWMADYL